MHRLRLLRLAVVYGVCLGVGLGLPGLADQMSRMRDREIERRLGELRHIDFVIDGRTYHCAYSMKEDVPLYECN